MKRTIIILIVLAVLGISGLEYYQANQKTTIKPLARGKVSFNAEKVDDLINNSQVIVKAVATSETKNLLYSGAAFVQTSLKVDKIFKGSEFINKDNIWLLQTLMVEDPIVSEGDRVLLFLEKYDGPVTSDGAFVLKGLYQGHYKIKNNELSPSASLKDSLNEDFKCLSQPKMAKS